MYAVMAVTSVPALNELSEKEKASNFNEFSLTHFTQQKRKLMGIATHFMFVVFINAAQSTFVNLPSE